MVPAPACRTWSFPVGPPAQFDRRPMGECKEGCGRAHAAGAARITGAGGPVSHSTALCAATRGTRKARTGRLSPSRPLVRRLPSASLRSPRRWRCCGPSGSAGSITDGYRAIHSRSWTRAGNCCTVDSMMPDMTRAIGDPDPVRARGLWCHLREEDGRVVRYCYMANCGIMEPGIERS
jgi:hypothetical protein